MPRRAAANRREVQPDAVYNNRLVTQLINKVLLDGKKATAERIVYTAFEIVAEKSEGGDALATFKKAMDNVKPTLEVKPKRVGGATYQIPVEISSSRRTALAMRWLIDSARKRSGRDMAARLAGELLDAARNEGNTVKKREDTHKMAEANQAFAHFRY